MDKYMDSLQSLLSEHGSATLSFISSKLNLNLDKSRELSHLFVDRNSDYSLLYSVHYALDDTNFKMCTVGHDELEDLSSKYKTLRSSVYAIKNNKYDMNEVSMQLFKSSLKLSQEEMCKSYENNTLYIPSFVNLRITNIKVRNFETRTPSAPYMRESSAKNEIKALPASMLTTESHTHKAEFTEKKEVVKHEPLKDNAPRVKSEPKKSFNENKRRTATEKSVNKTDTLDSKTKKLKVKQDPEVIEVDMDDKLFDKEQLEDPEPTKSFQEPTTIKFVEKVSKENTYIENGYFVVEESEDYVEVVKDMKHNREDKKHYSNGKKSDSDPVKPTNGSNFKKSDTTKSDSKKKMNQSSIMSFFKK